MFGLLLKNDENEICFTPMEKRDVDIASFHYVPDVKILNIKYTDQSEDMFTSEIDDEVSKTLQEISEILVVELDGQGEFEREYMTPLMTS